MKAFISVFSLLAVLSGCGAGGGQAKLQAAGQTDLTRDLAKADGERSSPLAMVSEKSPSEALVKALQELIRNCAVIEIEDRSPEASVYHDPRSTCADLVVVKNETAMTSRADFYLDGKRYTGVAYDNEDSDHGDIFDFALYDHAGRRIAVSRRTFFGISALMGLADMAKTEIRSVKF